MHDLVQSIAQAAFVVAVVFICQQFAFNQNGNIRGVELRVNNRTIPYVTTKAQIPFDQGRQANKAAAYIQCVRVGTQHFHPPVFQRSYAQAGGARWLW